MMIRFAAAAAFAAATLSFAAPASAGVLDHFQIKLGVSAIMPDESASTSINGDVEISDETVPTLQVEYFVSDNWSLELLCCVATHDVAAVNTDLGRVELGQVTHFPPTVTLKYHWTHFGDFQPYVGAGVNYTTFIDNDPPSDGPINHIDYSDSWGAALQAGFDYRLDDHWSVGLDARKVWISTDVDMDTDLGPVTANVDINPLIITAAIGYRF